MVSLNVRLLFTASIVLAGFLGIASWVLDKAFRETAETAIQQRMQGQIHALIAASDVRDDGTLVMPEVLPEARFSTASSGLYGQVTSNSGEIRWRSHSSVGLDIPYITGLERGVGQFQRVTTRSGIDLYTYSFGLAWEMQDKVSAFTYSIAESLDSYKEQVRRFRRSLGGWLAGLALVLLAVQALILRWGLNPLRRVADDLSAIENGKATHLDGEYPKELHGLTNNLNALIRSEREHLDRYRHSLSDLAHSLKTPLAVVRAETEKSIIPEGPRLILSEQVERMRQIVDYQLQRASMSGRLTLTTPVPVAESAQRVLNTVVKVYADKAVTWRNEIPKDLFFPGDKDDLLEILGNLIENAFKWCSTRVLVTGERRNQTTSAVRDLLIIVEDDGPGIPEDKIRAVLQRGVRADERVDGQGIGLAVVRDITQIYHGRLELMRSKMGGAKVVVSLPTKR